MPCPAPIVLAELASGACGAEDALLGHVADCPECRQVLAELAALRPGGFPPLDAAAERRALSAALPGHSQHAMRWAAAAALFLAAGLGLLLDPWRTAERPPGWTQEAPETAAGSPGWARGFSRGGLLEVTGSDATVVLGRTASLTLKSGSRAVFGSGEELPRLLAGELWLEVQGERVALRTSDAEIETDGATLWMGARQGAGLAWLREAHAGEAGGLLIVLSGAAAVRVGQEGPIQVRAGEELALTPGAEPYRAAGPPAWRGDGGWRRLLEGEGLPRILPSGDHALVPETLPEAYLWEAVFRTRTSMPSVAVLFPAGPAGGRGWQLPLGAAMADAPAGLRVSVRVREGWVRVQAGPYEVLSLPASALGNGLDAAGASCGLGVLGGEVELIECRWRPEATARR